MVTDEEYKKLENRVKVLEDRLQALAVQYSSLYMKSDMRIVSEQKHEEHKKHKDITRYEFQGMTYCKRQLVLECIKYYTKKNRIVHYAALSNVFPDYIQGSLGVIKKIEDAEIYANSSKRFYFSDENILHLKEGDYVICSQWDATNIKRFLKVAEDIGLEITPVTRKYME